MIIVAESGSTKTDWRSISKDGSINQMRTEGINPYFSNGEVIQELISSQLIDFISEDKFTLYFYGAGCGTEQSKAVIAKAFSGVYPQAEINVEGDLLAAARGLCGEEAGIACILGTGANSGRYNGVIITDNLPSLGYVLGDEGSGAYLGKQLLTAFVRKELPDLIMERLERRYSLTREIIVEQVYRQPNPNRYLASFSKFIFQNIKEPYLYQMVYEAFSAFIKIAVLPYEGSRNEKVHFTGGIAFYFSNILRQVANDHGVAVRNIVENPIAGLALYHQNQLLK